MKAYKTLVFSFILFGSSVSYAEQGSLYLEPTKCVTLKEGKTCYQDVIVNWKTNDLGEYCLLQANLPKPLKCWNGVNSGQHKFEFSHSNSTDFYLVSKLDNTRIAKQHFSVKWVYKKRPTLGWRLF